MSEEKGAQMTQGFGGYSVDFGFCSEMMYICSLDGEVTDIVTFMFKRSPLGTSLAVQWLRLPMQGPQVRSLVGGLRPCMPHGTAKKCKQ